MISRIVASILVVLAVIAFSLLSAKTTQPDPNGMVTITHERAHATVESK